MEITEQGIAILIVQRERTDFAPINNMFFRCSFPVRQLYYAGALKPALKILKQQQIDIIFLDFMLPDENGLELFTAIQAQSWHTPIVILTTREKSHLAQQAINKGAQDLLLLHELDEKILSKTILYSIERKRTSESLLLSNERYKLVSKATNDMVWDWDLLKNKVYRNKMAWDRLFGHEDDDSKLADSWWERIHPADRKKVSANIDHILSNKEVENFEIECRVIRNNGSFAYIVDRGYAIRNEEGEAIRLVGVTQNVTEQKEAEEKLRASEQRFRTIIEKSSEGLLLVNADGMVMDISSSGKKILGHEGYVSAELIQQHIIFPGGTATLDEAFTDIQKKFGRVKTFEYQYRKPDGATIWLEATFHNLLNESAIQAIVILFRDISFRKAFEEGLKVSEEKYRSLFNVNPSSIIISDPADHSIMEVNDAAIKEMGYSRKEFLHLKTTDLIQKADRVKVKDIAKSMKTVKDYQTEDVWTVLTSKGAIKYLNATSRAINYYGKQASLTIANNVSEKIELEKKLAEERLKSQHEITTAVITAQEQERELLGKELHDNINQILATTKLYIEFALTNDEMRNDLLVSAKDFIAAAVEELRNLSKSLLPPSLGEVGLMMALDELTVSMQTVNKFKLSRDWDGFDESLLSDKLKLTIFRIIQEQLSNIIKHASCKNVWIKIKLENKRLIVVIKDDGVGFTVTDHHKGVGLKNITSRAALHNGKMKLTSMRDKGCTLSLQFHL